MLRLLKHLSVPPTIRNRLHTYHRFIEASMDIKLGIIVTSTELKYETLVAEWRENFKNLSIVKKDDLFANYC